MPRIFARLCLVGSLLLASGAGCAASASVHAARDNQLAQLQKHLADDVRRGDFDEGDARDVAEALLEGALARATPPAGVDLIRQVRPCARSLRDALLDRAERDDLLAPHAAMILIDNDLASLDDLREHATRKDARRPPEVADAFRAVHARTLMHEGDGAQRRAFFLDGDEQVRIAAVRAAILTADPRDNLPLLDVARLDPNPAARVLAIRAVSRTGKEPAVRALRDLWERADASTREAIASAWASPVMFRAGGRDRLLWAMSTQPGTPALEAAAALADPTARNDKDAAAALAHLVRAIGAGLPSERIHAMRLAPLASSDVRAALARARTDKDEVIAVAAQIRSLDLQPPDASRAQVLAQLTKVAATSTPLATQARAGLARAKVRAITPLLTRDVPSRDALLRERAGLALVTLGDWPHAAPLLADPDPRVRTVIACAVLSATQ
ncbi:hypothetical protein [Chondromyces apiculatus]|uniref:HEAT repeat protein n=1 Tax=Chondromyces apiculatus DSM 436 TaxID=1192034 RepID=A0A017T964_9BACT|nr:hypothetical protein [Chondromyces apiculatus]EYF05813.1 Hypothetical protein CAP_2814 [Chondromyces apiculatus DSM 436]